MFRMHLVINPHSVLPEVTRFSSKYLYTGVKYVVFEVFPHYGCPNINIPIHLINILLHM